MMRAFATFRNSGAMIVLVVTYAVFSVAAPSFFGLQNLLDITHVISPMIIVATGMALVVMSGKLDISVGSIAYVASAGQIADPRAAYAKAEQQKRHDAARGGRNRRQNAACCSKLLHAPRCRIDHCRRGGQLSRFPHICAPIACHRDIVHPVATTGASRFCDAADHR